MWGNGLNVIPLVFQCLLQGLTCSFSYCLASGGIWNPHPMFNLPFLQEITECLGGIGWSIVGLYHLWDPRGGEGLHQVSLCITGLLSHVGRGIDSTGEGMHQHMHIFEPSKLGNVGDICLPHLTALESSGVHPCPHGW